MAAPEAEKINSLSEFLYLFADQSAGKLKDTYRNDTNEG